MESNKSAKVKTYNLLRPVICPFEKIIEYIPVEGELLDVGSGYGTFGFFLLARHPRLRITGLELSEKRVVAANAMAKRFPNLTFISGDIKKISIDKKFDVITCIDLIHHISEDEQMKVIRKIEGLLKNDGLLVLKDMDTKPFHKYVWNYIHDILINRSIYLNYISKERMLRLLEVSELVIQHVQDISNALYAHYLIIAHK